MIRQCGGEQRKSLMNWRASVQQRSKRVFGQAKATELRRQRILNDIIGVRAVLAWREDQVGAQRHQSVADLRRSMLILPAPSMPGRSIASSFSINAVAMKTLC